MVLVVGQLVGRPVGRSGQQVGPSFPLVMISAGFWSIVHLFAGSFPREVFWGRVNQSVVERSAVGLVGSLEVLSCSSCCWLVGLSLSFGRDVQWLVGQSDNNKGQGQGQHDEDKQSVSQSVNRRQQSTYGDCVGERMRRW